MCGDSVYQQRFFQSAATEMSQTFSVLGKCSKGWKVLDSIHAEELLDLSAHARNAICLAAASCLKQYN